MKNMSRMIILSLLLLFSGCCLFPAKTPPVTRVSEVINAVKTDLLPFYESPVLLEHKAPAGAVCVSNEGTNVVRIAPLNIKLTLKTVRATENDPSIGLVDPLGVLSIDPAYSGAYTRSNAQSLEVDLDTAKLEEIEKRVQKQSRDLKPILANANKGKDVGGDDHPLFKTIVSMGNELLNVDHTKRPCVTPKMIKSIVYFDVVNKSTGGIGIKVLGLKLGDKVTLSDEFHQVLEVDFNLEGSSQLLMQQLR
jgi:hypothetical protein